MIPLSWALVQCFLSLPAPLCVVPIREVSTANYQAVKAGIRRCAAPVLQNSWISSGSILCGLQLSAEGVLRGQAEAGLGVEGQTWTGQCRCREGEIGKRDLHQKRLEKGGSVWGKTWAEQDLCQEGGH